MNRLKFNGLALLLCFSLITSFIGLVITNHKAAADTGLSTLCVPPTQPFTINGKQQGREPSGWATLTWINRATIKVTYTPNGNCSSPSDLSSKYLAGSKEFAPLIEGNYVTNYFSDLNYRLCSGNSCADDSLIAHFGDNIYSAMQKNVPFNNYDAKVSIDDLNASLQNTHYIISIESSKAGIPGVSCMTSGANYELSIKGGGNGNPYWKCTGNSAVSTDTGLKVANTFQNKENFNITYQVMGSGQTTTIVSVLDKNNKYVWCQGSNSGSGLFKYQNCSNERIMDGNLASFAQLDKGSADALIHSADNSKKELVTVAGPNSESVQASAKAGGGTGDALKCEASGWTLAWVVCPIINAITDATDYIFQNAVAPLLTTPGIKVTDSKDPTFMAWVAFRDIADVLLVISVIVIVLAQSIGGGLLEAYTVKKVLPRILIAAVLINLSIYIVALMVDLTNIVGSGIYSLLTTPFHDANFAVRLNGADSALGLGVIVALIFAAKVLSFAALKAMIVPLLLFILLPVFLTFLAVLVTLILRRGIILLLIIISPIAFALYCLPNTEKYFRKWWKLLFETLLVYPIVFAIFAIARILPSVISTSGSTGGVTSAIAGIIAIIVTVAPLFFIPYAFKIAGGIVGNLHGSLTSFHRKGQEAIKGSANNPGSLRNRVKREAGIELSRAGISAPMIGAALNPARLTSGGRARSTSRIRALRQSSLDQYRKQAEQAPVFQTYKDDDAVMGTLALFSSGDQARQAVNAWEANSRAAGIDEAEISRQKSLKLDSIGAAEVIGFNAATRRAGLLNGATIGYALQPGEKGWNQAVGAMREISGGDEFEFRTMMNEFQYMAKGVGRPDLSANTDGNVTYNGNRAWGSVGLYQHGNGKPNEITGTANYFEGVINRSKDAGLLTRSDIDNFGNLSDNEKIELNTGSMSADNLAKVKLRTMENSRRASAVFMRELSTLGQQATGAVRDRAVEEKERLMKIADDDLKNSMSNPEIIAMTRGYDPRDQDAVRRQAEGQ
ncbi:MAG: hypothetical protein NVS1B7_1740 [Candidatus Saccharimonadales bacterium]